MFGVLIKHNGVHLTEYRERKLKKDLKSETNKDTKREGKID